MDQNQDGIRGKPTLPELGPEELRVLGECNRESFYYRCVPLSLLLGGTSFILQRNGVLAKSLKFGYAPKVFFGVIVGYIAGKYSYASVCAEKVMNLPDSRLGDTLRKRRNITSRVPADASYGVLNESSEKKISMSDAPMFYDNQADIREQEGLDGYNTVTETLSPYIEPEQGSTIDTSKQSSYEELRKKNRDDYTSKRPQGSLAPHKDSQSPSDYRREFGLSDETSTPESIPYRKRNKYGDIIED